MKKLDVWHPSKSPQIETYGGQKVEEKFEGYIAALRYQIGEFCTGVSLPELKFVQRWGSANNFLMISVWIWAAGGEVPLHDWTNRETAKKGFSRDGSEGGGVAIQPFQRGHRGNSLNNYTQYTIQAPKRLYPPAPEIKLQPVVPTMGWAIALHGGAGRISKCSISPAAREASESALQEFLDAGCAALSNGASALDVVELVVRMLENCPLFNAGVGSVLTQKGTVEMEASIMDGATRKSGAVSGLSTVVNPISLARLVMEKTPHVYLGYQGAEAFAKDQGVETREQNYFITPGNKERLAKALEAGLCLLDHSVSTDGPLAGGQQEVPQPDGQSGRDYPYANGLAANGHPIAADAQFETVGCVAVDINGHTAAATSTGGLVNKMVGRIGDTPIIGAGTYANEFCAVSATGKGEEIIRNLCAKEVASLMEYKYLTLKESLDTVIWKKLGEGNGGLIAVSSNGEVAMSFNTLGMYRASGNEEGHRQIGIWQDVCFDDESPENGLKSSAVVVFDDHHDAVSSSDGSERESSDDDLRQ
ncbi:hypothetical protein R1flu_012567 [Riccia fluitans]|uniref:beta-aspartyl-peptidase n=1 Tax=Riccia fluitans TaxID=41844 RepID=A0ABD1ZB63_9MARC